MDAMSAADRHIPVMLTRVIEVVASAHQAPDTTHVDGTLGMGGHAEAVLRACPQATVVGIDRDPQALELATARLEPFGERFVPVHAVFDELPEVLADRGLTAVESVLLDLGMSSLHIDDTSRGFAYREDAPLDMRMDPTRGHTVADYLDQAPEADIARVLKEYGEERYARRIAAAIVERRGSNPVRRTAELAELVQRCVPAAQSRTGGHPAKRTFQALRIQVNQELEVLDAVLPASLEALAVGGRCAVLSYHSLEDRRVKQAFAAGLTSSAPLGLPVELPEHAPYLKAITRGAELPSATEIAENPRSASAKFRAVQRIRLGGGPPR
ncbi:3-oxoacyl-[acyl-carrier-protein] synthase, mitochondrial-like [Platysternon megacephalum]|uniref:3-oxoacyl-[acyl-carrier-protein] synthase, mitochondrial-like n=1 Tax=Platysternon megacephalum TaxID=55544 RepID=A0A4D9DDP1_9SAUR|nr:3-oxoacyl-[acyl-carrier-protein] synthase, mitochondrial-like [Platysternon megacephalum]